jgi:hypothetical protein
MKTESTLQSVEPAELLEVEGGFGIEDVGKALAAGTKLVVDTIVKVISDVASSGTPAPK